MNVPFALRVAQRTRHLNTRLCLGLDPRPDAYLQDSYTTDPHASRADLRTHTLAVLERCAPYVAAVKPQLAYFELHGAWGLDLLSEVGRAARSLNLPIILDAKRGDIGSTAAAYAQAWLSGEWAGAALTVNPFLGFETLTPFVQAAREGGGAVYVLTKTSNPGQADLQGGGISERVAGEIVRLNREEEGLELVGAVVGATHAGELEDWRAQLGGAPLLLPGLGAQGARAVDLAGAFLPDGTGALVNASRGIMYAGGADLDRAAEAAERYRDELNAGIAAHAEAKRPKPLWEF
jgi:orotidine-5'-phosphate decarboxylase